MHVPAINVAFVCFLFDQKPKKLKPSALETEFFFHTHHFSSFTPEAYGLTLQETG